MIRTLLLASAALLPAVAHAQEAYPSRPVRVFVGFPAGTSADIVARIFTARLTDHFKRPFVVENRLGMAGNLATQAAFRSPADGHTLAGTTVANTISASVYRNLGYQFADDFAHVARVAIAPNVLVVSPTLGVTSVKALIELARAAPRGKMFFGSAGVGTAPHLSGELFNMMTGAQLTHVPYKGNAQGLIDLSEGRISLVFAPAPTLAAFTQDNRVRALATTATRRPSFLPDLPTLGESGLPGFDTAIWYGFAAPRGTPAAIVSTLSEALVRATEAPEVREQLRRAAADPYPLGGEDFTRFVRDDVAKWAKVVDFAQVRPE
jgi:tripartite-type tricarboxylate transporter receptor subunit TctC